MNHSPNWKSTTLLVGGAIGLLTGLAAAYLVVRNQEESGNTLRLTSGNGAKIGMGIVSLLRMVADTLK